MKYSGYVVVPPFNPIKVVSMTNKNSHALKSRKTERLEAIALTTQYASSVKQCAVCGKTLPKQNRSGYCKQHRHLAPDYLEKLREIRKK